MSAAPQHLRPPTRGAIDAPTTRPDSRIGTKEGPIRLTYLLDLVNGELSVGHSFVGGGDFPAVDTSRVGLLGADLVADGGRWRIGRIYTFESWNPDLVAPLDRPGLRVRTGQYLLGVDGVAMTAAGDPYRLLDGTAGRQTVLMVNDRPTMDGHWTVTVEPTRSEDHLRQRAWVEDNRRRVDSLSAGRLAYVWVPNTSGPGVVSFTYRRRGERG